MKKETDDQNNERKGPQISGGPFQAKPSKHLSCVASLNKLALPLPKTDCYKQSFSYIGVLLRNNYSARSSDSWAEFSKPDSG